MRHCRCGCSRDVVPLLIEGVRRLEYRGYDSTGPRGHQRWPPSAREHRARGGPREAGADDEHHRADRHLAHPLGDAWRADAGERASAHERRRGRGRAQRHHRELRVAARSCSSSRAINSSPRPIRGDRASDPRALQGRSAARPSGTPSRNSKVRTPSPSSRRANRARMVGARAGSPLIGRHRRAGPFPRIGCQRAGVRDAARRVSRGRRRRRHPARVVRDLRRCGRTRWRVRS